MSKKILIISSSPRRGSNSDALCDEFMRGAVDAGHEVEKVALRDVTVNPCRGCGACSFHALPCPQRDDAPSIVRRMVEADVIVMGTPVYFYSMSAQMKALIDRTCGPYTEMRGKEFYVIATAAEDDEWIMGRVMTGFQGFFDCLEEPVVRGTLFCGGVTHVGDIEGNGALGEAYQMGRQV